ncbi:hypothetical protein [Streptomyces sp. NPDC048419]|uniref:hypothetical protein n=1 Tax=Streptomyces sp. NPDC048419 TaxID=3365547 RepID=UPI0037204F08
MNTRPALTSIAHRTLRQMPACLSALAWLAGTVLSLLAVAEVATLGHPAAVTLCTIANTCLAAVKARRALTGHPPSPSCTNPGAHQPSSSGQ